MARSSGSDVLDAVAGAIARIREVAGPAVVGVGGGRALGSGVVVADGVVLTNAHNVGGEEVWVTFADGRTARAQLKGVDPDGDLAALATDTAGIAPVAWAAAAAADTGDSADSGDTGADAPPAAAGDVVFAAANPGGRGLRVTFGVVSAADRAFRGPRGRRIGGSLEHTAPLPRGASGGPVLDAEGRLVGVNTHRLGEGFYLAIPADAELRGRVDALARGESTMRPRLGVALAPSRVARHLRRAVGLPDRDGLLVRGVAEGSPAAQAGLAEGDLLVEAAGRPLASPDDLHAVLDGLGAGDRVALTVVRGADELTVEVVFDAATDADADADS
jgi:serine protease Do